MSAYYSIDGESPSFMGSVTGWGEAGEWIDGLDHSRYPLLVQFREHGIAEPASQLADEILTALVDEPPSDDVRGVVEELMTGCEDAGDAPVIFTYGEVPVSDEDGDWFSDDDSDGAPEG